MKKKVLVLAILSLFIIPLLTAIVSANFIEDSYQNSPLVQGVSYYIFGLKDLDSASPVYGATSVFIVFLLVWLILFVTFSDILRTFSFFQNKAVPWIVGGALTIIAANLSVIQYLSIWLIQITAVLGTISVFAGIIMAFVLFLAATFGLETIIGKLQEAKRRRDARRGIGEATTGISAARAIGREATGGAEGTAD